MGDKVKGIVTLGVGNGRVGIMCDEKVYDIQIPIPVQ